MTSKAEKIASNIDELLTLLPGAPNDGAKKQNKIEFLPNAKPDINNKMLLLNSQTSTYFSCTINDLSNLIIKDPAQNKIFLSSVAVNYPFNNGFRFDSKGDGLGDHWDIMKSADINRADISTTITGGDVFMKGQQVTTDKLTSSPNSYYGIKQIFPRDFMEDKFTFTVKCYSRGELTNPVNIRLSWASSNNGPFSIVFDKKFTPAQNDVITAVANHLPSDARFIEIDIYIQGPGEVGKTSGFMVVEPKITPGLISAGSASGITGINIIDNGSNVYNAVSSLTFTNFTVSTIDNTHVEITNPILKVGNKLTDMHRVSAHTLLFPTSAVSNLDISRGNSTIQIVPKINFTDAAVGKSIFSEKLIFEDGLTLTESDEGYASLSAESVISWRMGQGFGDSVNKASILSFGDGLIARPDDKNDEVVKISVEDSLLKRIKITQWLSVCQIPLNITRDSKAYWFGESLFDIPGNIVGDAKQKVIYISPVPGQSTQFLVVFKVNFYLDALEDGYIRIFAREHDVSDDHEEYITDIHGSPLAVERHYKKGDKLDGLLLAGIVEYDSNFGLKFYIEHSFNQPLKLDSYVENVSAVLIQAVGVNTQSLYEFEDLSDTKIKMYTHRFNNPIASLSNVMPSTMTPEKYTAFDVDNPPEYTYFSEGGYLLAPLNADIVMHIENDRMDIFNDTLAAKRSYFYLFYVFYPSETTMLRGKDLVSEIVIDSCDLTSELEFVIWNGTGDISEADNPITEFNKGQYVYGKDWTKAPSTNIPLVNSRSTFTLKASVPTNCRACAFIYKTTSSKKNWSCRLIDFTISSTIPFTGAILKYVKPLDEITSNLSKGFARYVQDIQGHNILRYTINSTESACPVGRLTKNMGLPIVVDPTENTVPGSMAGYGEGAIKFTEDAINVNINTSVRIFPGENLPADSQSNVIFTWYKIAENGAYEAMEQWAPALAVVKKGGAPQMFAFSVKNGSFNRGDRIALRMKADGNDYAFLQSSSPHLPLVENIISFEELK